MRSVLAADLGGTKCRFGLVDEQGGVHCATRIPSTMDVEVLLDGMVGAFRHATAGRPAGVEAPHAVGVGTAGIIGVDRKTVEWVGNLPLTGFPLGQRLEASLGVPATVVNDGRASAMGEARFGHARGRDPLLALFFGKTTEGVAILAAILINTLTG
jgi:glucokinase